MRSATSNPWRRGSRVPEPYPLARRVEGQASPGLDWALRSFETSHARITLWELAGTGMPLVLLHGRSGCKADFHNLMSSLRALRRRAVAIDLPGHGTSGGAHDRDLTYTLSGYADSVIEVLEHLGIERAAVIGQSLGAHVGLEMATSFPGFSGLMVAQDGLPEGLAIPHRPVPRSASDESQSRHDSPCGDGRGLRVVSRADERYRRLPSLDRAPTPSDYALTVLETAGTMPFAEWSRADECTPFDARPTRALEARGSDGATVTVRSEIIADPDRAVARPGSLLRFLEDVDRTPVDHPTLGLCLSC